MSEPLARAATQPRIDLLGLPGLRPARARPMALERKTAALLALLAIDGARPRAALAALLWPDATPAQARNSLRQRLFRLQRAAGAEIVAGHDELRLADGIALDLHDLDARLAHDPGAASGELLQGLDYDDTAALAEWVDAAREQWRRRRSDCLAELASRHESQQQVVRALQYAQRLLADEPLLEHAHRRLMRLHYLRGDRAAALAAYERCQAVLRAELGTAPDPETRALAATIGAAATAPGPIARAVPPPVSVLRPPQLIGRDGERQRLSQAVAARQVLLLHGEPGIGKTRLLEDVAATHPALLATGAHIGDARVPYALLARIATGVAGRFDAPVPDWVRPELARLVPALGRAPAARLDPLRLLQAFEAAFAAWAEAGLGGMIVDDLHHADEASIEALLALAAPGRAPLAWLLGVRTREMPAALRDAMAAAGAERLALGALDPPALGRLIDSLGLDRFAAAGWHAALARHSGGNPLFALETVRALLALGDAAPAPDAVRLPVPTALDALIDARLAPCSPAALKLVRVAALAGADFDPEVAAAVLDAHPLDIADPWRELEDAQLLHGNRFTHDLIAETVQRGVPAGIARALQARLAGSLAALGRSPARVAPHWAAAEAWARAGDAYAAAARDARRASRRSDEVALWDHAADAHERAGQPGMAFDARADSVEGVILVRGLAAAAERVDRLDADQRTEPQRMRVMTLRACVCLMGGQAEAAEAAARPALDAATRLGALWPRFEAARLLAVALSQQGRADEALATIEPYREPVEAHGDAEQRHHFWADYAYTLRAAQRASDTAAALRQAMVSAQEAGDVAELATLTSNLALVEGNLGRVEQALDHARQARVLNDPLGLAVGPPAGAIELYVSVHEAALGRYAEALAGFERARACFADNPGTVWIGLGSNHLAHVLIQLGQFARAHQTLQWSGSSSPGTLARRTLLRARIDRALNQRHDGALDGALAELGGADPLVRLLIELEATLDRDPDAAVAACDACIAQAERMEHLAVAMRARLLRLQHRSRAGTLACAEVDDAVERVRRIHPADTYFAEAWWIVARAYDTLGCTAPADAALREGFDWVAGRALPHVPPAFRDSFLDRNAVNRELLAAAGRRLGLRVPGPALTGR